MSSQPRMSRRPRPGTLLRTPPTKTGRKTWRGACLLQGASHLHLLAHVRAQRKRKAQRMGMQVERRASNRTQCNRCPERRKRPHSARKIIREKSSGRGAHRADLLSAYRAWRKVVRATRPERVVLAFAPPGILVLPPSAETTTARFSSESPGLHGLCFRSSSSAAACRLCRLCTGTGREAKKHFLFLPPGSLCWDRTINGSRAACSLCPVLLCF